MTDTPDSLNHDILRLVATIRQMDQKIYRMGQCSSWAQMQPIFAELLRETNGRMQDESRRIQTLLIPEIRKAYLNGAAQIEAPPKPRKPRLQLEGPRHANHPQVPVRRRDRQD